MGGRRHRSDKIALAPFPYFGGKSRVANVVWKFLGSPKHYMEPFFGSGAVLLSRPFYDPKNHVETVNDKDGFVCNVWRALKFAPHEIVKWCDWPANHADLLARRKALLKSEEHLLKNLIKDPEWCDPVIAGYWIWVASCSVHMDFSTKARPQLSSLGQGVIVKSGTELLDLFECLSMRLRNVRVVCGDWTQICGGNWQDFQGKSVGIFFDPPYSSESRTKNLYREDSKKVAEDVSEWALEHGKLKNFRIVVAGYEGEHELLCRANWSVFKWASSGGASTNRKKERLFCSPHCLGISNWFKKDNK